jgi:prophage tail gpP-like protein
LLPLAPVTRLGEPVENDPPIPQPGRIGKVKANFSDEVTLLIDGVIFSYWESVTINTQIDTFSTVNFTAPFEPDDLDARRVLVPLSFKLIQLFIGGEPYFFGRMLPIVPSLESDKRTVEVGCYSYPATLNDCTIPVGQKPEFIDVGILSISDEICEPFAINVIEPVLPTELFATNEDPFNPETFRNYNEPFAKVSIDVGEKIIEFLSKLAARRNILITDNANGDLVYLRANSGGISVAHLQEGHSPLLSVVPELKTQEWYSDITGVQSQKMTLEGSASYTLKNKFLPGVFRPYTFKVKDVDTTVQPAVESKFARMVANVVTYKIEVIGWRDQAGRLWTKNTMLDVTAPSAMIYERYQFLIKGVEFRVNAERQTAVLSLVLPGSFTGVLPETLPWGL